MVRAGNSESSYDSSEKVEDIETEKQEKLKFRTHLVFYFIFFVDFLLLLVDLALLGAAIYRLTREWGGDVWYEWSCVFILSGIVVGNSLLRLLSALWYFAHSMVPSQAGKYRRYRIIQMAHFIILERLLTSLSMIAGLSTDSDTSPSDSTQS
jgi:hypothetical protein